jgi:hypothetical protein
LSFHISKTQSEPDDFLFHMSYISLALALSAVNSLKQRLLSRWAWRQSLPLSHAIIQLLYAPGTGGGPGQTSVGMLADGSGE